VIATIQALETGDETWYVLRRDDLEPVVAYWPHPLLELEPDAIRISSWDTQTVIQSDVNILGWTGKLTPLSRKWGQRGPARENRPSHPTVSSPRNRGKESSSMELRDTYSKMHGECITQGEVQTKLVETSGQHDHPKL